MSRARIDYATGGGKVLVRIANGVAVETPVPGFYRMRLRGGGVFAGIRVWFGQPKDPVTGELLDRSLRWQAESNGDYVDFDDVWPQCAKERISEAEYHRYCKRQAWAQSHAPSSAYADPKRRYDPLSTQTPLPF